jgi:hypothetical protein
MKLVQFASLWTLVNHPSRQREWSLEKKLQAIRASGFGGVRARLDFAIGSLARQEGLFAIGLVFADEPSDFANLLRVQKGFGAERVDVQLGTHLTSPTEAVRKWLLLEKEAVKLELTLSLETHRGTATETLEKLLEIAQRYEKATGSALRISWDFSHYAVVRDLRTGNFAAQLLTSPTLIQHASQFQFRPFNGEHAQLPVTYKREITPEVLDYLAFAEEVMKVWKAGPQNRESTLFACPDLGPVGGYALTNFPAVWPDALALSAELTRCWKNASA